MSSSTAVTAQERAAALLQASNTRIFESMEDKLHETQVRLQQTSSVKEELAVNMYSHQKEAARLRHLLSAAEAKAQELETSNTHLAGQTRQAVAAQRVAEQRGAELRSKQERLQALSDERLEQIQSLQEVCKTLKTGLKAQQMSESALQKHVELLDMQVKQAGLVNEELKKVLKRSDKDKASLENRLAAQETQVKVSQRQLQKAVEEMSVLSASKTVLQSQWQASLLAMTKRDKVLEEAERKRLEAEHSLRSEISSAGGTVSRVRSLEAQLADQSQLRCELDAKLVEVRNQLHLATGRTAELGATVERHQVALKHADERLAKARAEHVQFETARERAHRGHQDAQTAFINKDKELQAVSKALEAAQERCRRLEADGGDARASGEGAGLDLRAANAKLESKASQLLLQNRELQQKEYAAVREAASAAASADAHVQEARQLRQQVCKLESERLRLGYRINKLESASDNAGGEVAAAARLAAPSSVTSNKDKARMSTAELRERAQADRLKAAEKVAREQQKELDTLRLEWSRAEGALIRKKKKIASLGPELAAQVAATELLEHGQRNSDRTVARMQADATQRDAALNLVRVQQRHVSKSNASLKSGVVDLEARVAESELRQQKQHVRGAEVKAGLAARVRGAKRTTQKALRDHQGAEGRCVVLKGRHELLRAQLSNARSTSGAAAARAQGYKLKVNQLTAHSAGLAKRLQHAVRANNQKGNREATIDLKGSLLLAIANNNKNSSGQQQQQQMQQQQQQRRPSTVSMRQAKSNLLRAVAEAASSKEKVVELQQSLDAAHQLSSRLDLSVRERDSSAAALEAEARSCRAALFNAQGRCERAVGVAAGLEKQLQITLDSPFISYEARTDVEPSAVLQNALRITPVPPDATTSSSSSR